MFLNCVVIPANVVYVALTGVAINWSHVSNVLANLIINSIHVWLAKTYSIGWQMCPYSSVIHTHTTG